jgi:hypothetical protein
LLEATTEQIAKLPNLPEEPDLSGFTPDERKMLHGGCTVPALSKDDGPDPRARYYACLREQIEVLQGMSASDDQ